MHIKDLKKYKQEQRKITALTAYDYSFAKIFDNCGIDMILIGDSLANVIQGEKTTLSVNMLEMIYHTKNSAKAIKNALIISDMPYKSFENEKDILTNAKQLINAGASIVKIEGADKINLIAKLIKNNINVCSHLGLLPQSFKTMGYKVQGRNKQDADKILNDAILLEQAGVSLIVLECIPFLLAKKITEKLTIPTIGIGAGIHCDGQILVSYDMLGISATKTKFSKNFAKNLNTIQATKEFIKQVKLSKFPTEKHSYK